MNPKIQFDRHPDADALSAFAEQALPVADRARILAHMASCARCREVVYLAQAAAQPEPAPAIAIKAQPEWSWASALAKWRIVLIPAAALAATFAAVVWVQTRPAPPPAQMAKVSQLPPAAPGSDLAPMAQQKSAPLPAAIAPRQPVALPPRPPAAFAARTQPLPQPEQKKAMPAAGTMDPNALALASAPPPLAAATAQSRALAPTHLDAHSASMARYNPVPAPSIPPPALSLTPSSLTPQLQPQPEAVLRPVPVGNVPSAAEAPAPQPLNVAPMLAARPVNLPSGKSAVSSAALLNRLLAVDSAGSVFLSQDAGKHWETVDPKWTGKAIQVEARPQNPHRLSNTEVSVEPATPSPQPPVDAAAKAVPPLPPMLFRLVTDRRQTWVSTDGRVWHEQ